MIYEYDIKQIIMSYLMFPSKTFLKFVNHSDWLGGGDWARWVETGGCAGWRLETGHGGWRLGIVHGGWS